MNVKLLKNDGRCKWLENIFLNKLVPMMQESKAEGGDKKIVLIEDWVSNDGGKVGLDLKWLASLNIEVKEHLCRNGKVMRCQELRRLMEVC